MGSTARLAAAAKFPKLGPPDQLTFVICTKSGARLSNIVEREWTRFFLGKDVLSSAAGVAVFNMFAT